MPASIAQRISALKENLRTGVAVVLPPKPVYNASLPCVHLGDPTGTQHQCGSCVGKVMLKEHACRKHGVCVPTVKDAPVRRCGSCGDYKPATARAPLSDRAFKRWDETNLVPSMPGLRFNPSLIAWRDGYVLAFRNGWRGCDLYTVTLDAQLQVNGPAVKIDAPNKACNYGREDPRLFVHNDALHVVFAGVVGGRQIRHTNVLYARLNDARETAALYHPNVPGRQLWEKNHSYFSHNGALYAIYQITPHRIMRVEGERVQFVHETPTRWPWTGGDRRGGACPIRVGDEYWHFFHDRVEVRGHRTYRTGLYCFEAKPPFRATRYIPEPILTADPSTKPTDQYASVVWTAGAVRHGSDWVLASGIHDRWTELHRFSHTELLSRLVDTPPG